MFGFQNSTKAAPPAPMIEIKEIVVALLVVHLTANTALIARAVSTPWFALMLGGCAFLLYAGVSSAKKLSGARRAIGWVNASWSEWLAAALIGCLLGSIVTAATVASGHSIQVTEPVYSQVLAITLGPVLEEICLRGVLVPLLARVVGPTVAVVTAAVLFSLLHTPASALKLVCIGITGIAYGWIRIRSGSTAVAAVAHAAYNLSILIYGAVGIR